MPDDDLALLPAPDLQERFRTSRATPFALFSAQKRRRVLWEPQLRAYRSLSPEAEAQARAAHGGVDPERPLAGLTLGVKDLFDVQGLPTTGGSAAYGQTPADADASVVARLRTQGAVITGKLHTEELAFGIICAPTRNPWGLDRIPGGSSGGSAAALAAGMVSLALGTDTAGSIRIPAALCGVTGLKPTAGRVGRSGILPLSLTLDHAGPMARDTRSLALLFSCMVGYDPDDAASLPCVPEPPPETRRLGIPWAWFREEAEPDVLEAFAEALRALQGLGYASVEVDLPPYTEFMRLQVAIRAPETWHVHEAAIGDRPEAFGPGLVQRIAKGRGTRAEDHVEARAAAHRLTRQIERQLAAAGIDGLLLPTTPVTAPPAGAPEVVLGSGRATDVRDALIRYTAAFNVTGWPAVSIPMGLDRSGLPMGLQLAGRRFEDERLLARADALSAELPRLPWPQPPAS